MNERWRIGELASIVLRALEKSTYDGQPTERVRSVPDSRTIRYYTTIGLLDKPAEIRGRTAYYVRRHVLQLVAIKRLQARGLPLVDVQRALAGADDAALRRWAALPAGFWKQVKTATAADREPLSPDELLREQQPRAGTNRTAMDRERFWAAAPIAQPPDRQATDANGNATIALRSAVEVLIAPGVRLVIDDVDIGRFDDESLAELAPTFELLRTALAQAGFTGRNEASK